MTAKQRLKSFDELSVVLQRMQQEMTQRFNQACSVPLIGKSHQTPPVARFEAQIEKSVFRTAGGVPLRGFGLNE